MRRRTLLAAVPALAAGPARAQTVWRCVTEYPATSMPGEGIATFAGLAASLSSGALRCVPAYDAPDGLRSAGMMAAVGAGQVQVADAFTGALGGQAALYELSALPFLTQSAGDTAALLDAARPAYRADLAGRGLTLLYATPWPATGLWSRAPVRDAAALLGLRVRTYDAAGTAVLRAAGAAPVQISFADALPRLRDGTLDAVLSSGDGGAGARLWEVLPHFTRLDYASPLSLAFCATSTLAALGPSERGAILGAAGATERRQFAAIQTRTTENDARMAEHGVTVATAPALRAALVLASVSVIDDWAIRSGPGGADLIRTFRTR